MPGGGWFVVLWLGQIESCRQRKGRACCIDACFVADRIWYPCSRGLLHGPLRPFVDVSHHEWALGNLLACDTSKELAKDWCV